MEEANSHAEERNEKRDRKILFNEQQFPDLLRLEFKCDIVCQTFIYVLRVGVVCRDDKKGFPR